MLVHQESLFLGYYVSLDRVSHWPGLRDQAKTAGQQSSSPRLELQVCVTVPGFIHIIEPNMPWVCSTSTSCPD